MMQDKEESFEAANLSLCQKVLFVSADPD